MSVHVADGRIGEYKDIGGKEETVAGLATVSWDENSEKTKQKCFNVTQKQL
jgi:hypothetical protein